MSRKKQIYYRVIIDDYNCGVMKLDDARRLVFESFKESEEDCSVYVTKVKLTEKQFNDLPEID